MKIDNSTTVPASEAAKDSAKRAPTTARINFPFPVKQVGPKTVEFQVAGTGERPLNSTVFSRLADNVGVKEAERIERKVATMLLREEIASSIYVEG